MNKDKLKSIINKKAKGNSKLSNQFYQMYFFEHILERLSLSKYKNNIILKGGLFLSSILGEDLRATKDMDAYLKSMPLDEESILNIFNEILNIDINDNITFKIEGIKDIREKDEYGGFRINVLASMDTIKIYLEIEISTGDIITPKEMNYMYNSKFENKKIAILTYNIETVLAEKFQTIIEREELNTRMKDFYDIYMLLNSSIEINFDNTALALKNTFKNRTMELDFDELEDIIINLFDSTRLQNEWKKFKRNNIYVKDISFLEVMESIYDMLEYIDKEKFLGKDERHLN